MMNGAGKTVRFRKLLNWMIGVFGALAASPIVAPQLLAFPYQEQIGDTTVYSETPIRPNIGAILARSDTLLRASPIHAGNVGRRVFLTRGGWRWNWLALQSRDGYALTRPFSLDAIILNKNDISSDLMARLSPVGQQRTVSAIIAHERTHWMIWKRFGTLRSIAFATWKTEGYADHVAQESSLSDADVAKLKRERRDHPALPYYLGRKRVAATLAANGGSVDELFD